MRPNHTGTNKEETAPGITTTSTNTKPNLTLCQTKTEISSENVLSQHGYGQKQRCTFLRSSWRNRNLIHHPREKKSIRIGFRTNKLSIFSSALSDPFIDFAHDLVRCRQEICETRTDFAPHQFFSLFLSGAGDMTNLWLLAQMRQPGRSIYQDLDRCTFNELLDALLDRDNFNFYKEVESRALISPSWSFCLSYEFEIRKEAFRLCKEQQYGIQAALWATSRNTEHRMKHWLQLIAIPNTPSSSSSSELQSLKKRITDLEKARSRSPRRNAKTGLSWCWPGYACPPCSCSSPSRSKNLEERIARVVRKAREEAPPLQLVRRTSSIS